MNENNEKTLEVVNKIQLIVKRVILGMIILPLLFFILLDTILLKQTIKSRNYDDAIATCTDIKVDKDDSMFDDYIYTFTDKNGKEQEIVMSIAEDEVPKQTVKIKYNEKKPQDFYEETAILSKKDITWYIVRVVILVLLIFLFFNKKILNKLNLSVSSN